MKMVTAIIKPFRLDHVREALSDVGVQGITVTEGGRWEDLRCRSRARRPHPHR